MAKGHKTGGRKAGTPNKVTKDLRNTLREILDQEIERIPEYLEELTAKERIDALIKLVPYIIPKASGDPVEEDQETNNKSLVIEIPVPVDKDGNRVAYKK